jgi:hypothetical protein
LKVLDFLYTVKEAMDLNHVSEGVAAAVLPYLLAGEDKDRVLSMWKSSTPKVPKCPAAVAWLLESYATDAGIDAAADKFLTAKQNPGEGGRRLCLQTTTVCQRSWKCLQRRRPGVPVPCRVALVHRKHDPWTSIASHEVHSSEELGRPGGTRRERSRGFQPRIL